jgi:SAM-dependent methyltransferase
MPNIAPHPAKYSNILLPIFREILAPYARVLDPFAGTGKLKWVRPDAYLLEIEREWAAIGGAVIGDATCMPWKDGAFDAICTSPSYGNRMADNFVDHQTDKNYKRNTYRHYLGREMNPNNSGGMNWGKKYRSLHEKAWGECFRVLRPKGVLVLNISDHIRKGKIVPVSAWHLATLMRLGFVLIDRKQVTTRRNKMGRNGQIRVDYEQVFTFMRE